jgi:hypothetical protein
MAINVDLLKRTLAYIEAHPDEWDQSMWATTGVCGTTFCFAGTAVHLSGGRPYFDNLYSDDATDAYFVVPGSVPEATGRPGEYENKYSTVARKLLGLDIDQGTELFDENNKLSDLRRIVAKLTAVGSALDGEPVAGA